MMQTTSAYWTHRRRPWYLPTRLAARRRRTLHPTEGPGPPGGGGGLLPGRMAPGFASPAGEIPLAAAAVNGFWLAADVVDYDRLVFTAPAEPAGSGRGSERRSPFDIQSFIHTYKHSYIHYILSHITTTYMYP